MKSLKAASAVYSLTRKLRTDAVVYLNFCYGHISLGTGTYDRGLEEGPALVLGLKTSPAGTYLTLLQTAVQRCQQGFMSRDKGHETGLGLQDEAYRPGHDSQLCCALDC